jgi:hypothetical protein
VQPPAEVAGIQVTAAPPAGSLAAQAGQAAPTELPLTGLAADRLVPIAAGLAAAGAALLKWAEKAESQVPQ